MRPKYFPFFYILFSSVIIFVPFLAYCVLFFHQIQDIDSWAEALKFTGVLLPVAVFSFLVYFFLKIIKKRWLAALLSGLFYGLLLSGLFYDVAFQYRVEFGNTWSRWEVFCELVFFSGWVYFLLLLGLAGYLLLNIYAVKKQ